MVTIRRRDMRLVLDAAEVLRSRDVAAAVHAVAERVAARARASAPADTGEYRSSIRVEDRPTRTRARSRVVASAAHATVVEARTGNLKRAGGA